MQKFVKSVLSAILVTVLTINCIGIFTTEVKAVEETKDYTIKVNLGTNCTTIYDKDGEPIKAMICSPSNETPTGTFYIPVKYRWHEMIGNCYAQYCSRITTGILFHSVWYYKNGDKSTMSVSAYNVMGQKASHGCVRLLCKDAKWIYDHCAVGTKIVIFWGGSKDDPLGRPSFTPIRTGAWISWDPTDPDPNNPYQKAKPSIEPKSKTIEYGKKVKKIDLVNIKDSAGNTLTKKNATIKINGKINTKELGRYKIKYYVKDSLGNSRTKTIKFRVVDTKKPRFTNAKGKKNIALGSNVNLLENVKANAVSGRDLTSRITVKVKLGEKKIKVTNGVVQFNEVGTYDITYKVKGVNKKTRKKTVKYVVVDKSVNLELTTDHITIESGGMFDPMNYVKILTTYKGSVIDPSKYITIEGTVDLETPGVYVLVYKAQYQDDVYTANGKTLTVTVTKAEEEMTTGENDSTVKEETSTGEKETTVEETTIDGNEPTVEEETTITE